MGDISYETLMAARKVKTEATQEFDIMKMANVALGILEQVNRIKGNTPQTHGVQGGNVMVSRPDNEGTGDKSVQTPKIDVKQILGALSTVKQLKGDIKITELEKLLKEHASEVEMLLGKL